MSPLGGSPFPELFPHHTATSASPGAVSQGASDGCPAAHTKAGTVGTDTL